MKPDLDSRNSCNADTSTWSEGTRATGDSLSARFRARIADASFPCVGSKAALARDAIETVEYPSLACPRSAERAHADLADFASFLERNPIDDTTVHSFVALFQGPRVLDESSFDRLLWAFLQRLHDVDRARGYEWASDASSDPNDVKFSLSLAGHPFFVIGLHPGASRLARRFESPVLVFNSHRQFDRLRADGRYVKMQAATRARDIALQGCLNPNLADFGTAPETRQYSGRAVEADWRCPLDIRTGAFH